MDYLETMFPNVDYVVVKSVYDETGNVDEAVPILLEMAGETLESFHLREQNFYHNYSNSLNEADLARKIIDGDEYFQELERELYNETTRRVYNVEPTPTKKLQDDLLVQDFYRDYDHFVATGEIMDDATYFRSLSRPPEKNEFEKFTEAVEDLGKEIKSKIFNLFKPKENPRPTTANEENDGFVLDDPFTLDRPYKSNDPNWLIQSDSDDYENIILLEEEDDYTPLLVRRGQNRRNN